MVNYDLLLLSPYEFENLSRDLLQKKISNFIESFTPGPDSGIDLLFRKPGAGKSIVQAKRIATFNNLLTDLKKEVKNTKSLNPDRYIITTTVGLTPANKETIKKLFTPFILSTEDILGRDDLNNLLSQYSDIELKYYKLWLSSTTVIQKIINSKIVNQSLFELEEIHHQLRLYVQNDSLNKSLDILNKHKYVIISGIPGIGKTTLGRIIILNLLSQGYDEMVFLSDSIDDAFQSFNEGKKQIFFFDDFLGRITFDNSQEKNEDANIIKFISKIQRTSGKLLIFTTREYILKQAISASEAFHNNNIELAKCIVDVSSYTKLIKAKILYNHLYFSDIPKEYLLNIAINDNYKSIIEHHNYNPRIIETIIKRHAWDKVKPANFPSVFKNYFDNPETVWQYAFESLPDLSQLVLINLLTLPHPVLMEDLETSVKEYLRINNHNQASTFDFIKHKKTLRTLQNTFIKIEKDPYNTVTVDFQNPSIQDFLINYVRSSQSTIKNLLASSIFSEQFFTIFRTKNEKQYYGPKKILVNDYIPIIARRLVDNFDSIRSAKVARTLDEKTFSYVYSLANFSIYTFMKNIIQSYGEYDTNLEEFIYKKFESHVYVKFESQHEKRTNYAELIDLLDMERIEFHQAKLLNNFLNQIDRLEDIESFAKLRNKFNVSVDPENDFAAPKITTVIQDQMKKISGSDISEVRDQIYFLGEDLNYDFSEQIDELEKREADYQASLEEDIEISDVGIDTYQNRVAREEAEIKRIFSTLGH